jgi:hypothetical protein
MRTLLLCLIAFAVSACAANSQRAQAERALELTPDHFRLTASVKDDALDTIATLTTVNGFQQKHGLLGVVWDDNFVRAFIDKKTGKTAFQLYQVIRYTGRRWHFYQSVNYETPSGPLSRELTVINRDVDCTSTLGGGCTYAEHVAFDVEESLLRRIAASYGPGKPVAWKFKFLARSGGELHTLLLPAEARGAISAVDAYRARRGFLSVAR